MLADLDSRGSGNLDSRTVTICSGLDFVNISYNNFVAADEKTAKVSRINVYAEFRSGVRSPTSLPILSFPSPFSFTSLLPVLSVPSLSPL